MRDRQLFEETKLSNGITIFSYPTDVPFAIIKVVIPIGHIHSIIPGSVHFLEHAVMNRLSMYPQNNSFEKFVCLKGGSLNAYTNFFRTEYKLKASITNFNSSIHGFFDHIFNPSFNEEAIEVERGIIRNEMGRELWYPGNNPMSKFLLTEWKQVNFPSLEQMLGNDSNITIDILKNIHKYYFNTRTYAIVGGSFDLNLICSILSQLKTSDHHPEENPISIIWKKRDYFEEEISDINNPCYLWGGIAERISRQDKIAIGFIGTILDNDVQGTIFKWLRQENGWTYDVSFETEDVKNFYHWDLHTFINDKKQAKIIRDNLHKKVISSIKNEDLIFSEIERITPTGHPAIRSILHLTGPIKKEKPEGEKST